MRALLSCQPKQKTQKTWLRNVQWNHPPMCGRFVRLNCCKELERSVLTTRVKSIGFGSPEIKNSFCRSDPGFDPGFSRKKSSAAPKSRATCFAILLTKKCRMQVVDQILFQDDIASLENPAGRGRLTHHEIQVSLEGGTLLKRRSPCGIRS